MAAIHMCITATFLSTFGVILIFFFPQYTAYMWMNGAMQWLHSDVCVFDNVDK